MTIEQIGGLGSVRTELGHTQFRAVRDTQLGLDLGMLVGYADMRPLLIEVVPIVPPVKKQVYTCANEYEFTLIMNRAYATQKVVNLVGRAISKYRHPSDPGRPS